MMRASAGASENLHNQPDFPGGRFVDIASWTQGKHGDPVRNEDQMHGSSFILALADGATDKTGTVYPSGKTGGRELAELVTRVAAASLDDGYKLTDVMTSEIRQFYKHNNPGALRDPSQRASTALAVAKLMDDIPSQLILTQVGDVNMRITRVDGSTETFIHNKQVDAENAAIRARVIRQGLADFVHRHNREPTALERAQIVAAGRTAIQANLHEQYRQQNNSRDQTYGYGTLDGQNIPRKYKNGRPSHFVRTFHFLSADITTVELATDGFYGVFPEGNTIEDYEELYKRIHAEDPDKYLSYPSTKPLDDASVIRASVVTL